MDGVVLPVVEIAEHRVWSRNRRALTEGRDADIVRPWGWMIVYAVVMVTAFFGGIIAAFAGAGTIGTGSIGLAVLMFVYKYFFYNYREMAQSWLVYETICGRDRSYADAKQKAKEQKSGVRKLAGLDMLMAYLMSQRGGDNEGWGAKLVSLFLAGLNEVWDLVNHYMLPAIAIDELTLTDGVKKMKELRNQVPETLTGVFGIDFIGRIVGQVTGGCILCSSWCPPERCIWRERPCPRPSRSRFRRTRLGAVPSF